jgi:hypothetical protein
MEFLRPGANTVELQPLLELGEGMECPGDAAMLSVFDDSQLELPEFANVALGGDLRRFGSAAFPYAGQPDATAQMVVLGADPATIGAAWSLRGRLAQSGAAPLRGLAVTSAIPEPARQGLIVVGASSQLPPEWSLPLPWRRMATSPARSPEWAQTGMGGEDDAGSPSAAGIRARWAQRLQVERGGEGDTLIEKLLAKLTSSANARSGSSVSAPDAKSEPSAAGPSGILVARPSPALADRQLTVLTAESPAALSAATERLLAPAIWERLEGDLARWSTDSVAPITQRLEERFLIEPLGGDPSQLRLAALTFLSYERPVWIAMLLASLVLLSLGTGWALRRRNP